MYKFPLGPDIPKETIMSDSTRTTVTLDADVQRLLKDMAYRTGKPYKWVLNDALRQGLNPQRSNTRVPSPVWPVYDLGLPLVNLTHAMALADELDDQEHARRMAVLNREWNAAQANDAVGGTRK
jgi:hypothetical protein